MSINSKRLVFFEHMTDAGLRLLGEVPEIETVRLRYGDPESGNWAVMAEAHGYHIQPRTELREPWFGNAALLERCPKLLAVASTGAGYDMIDIAACTAAGVAVLHQSGTNKEAVAEHALGMMLALSKRIAETDKAMRRRPDLPRREYLGRDLQGKTVGVIGFGQIGSRTAELCAGLFGMTVLAYDPYLDAGEIAGHGARKVALDELLTRSDFVTVHCPRTNETMGMMGAREFGLMKETAYYVVTARGGITDEAALADALAGGGIAGAGIDVWVKEPPDIDHPLMAFENVIVSPHNAGLTAEAVHNVAVETARQWIGLFRGERPPRLANPEVWPRYRERFEAILGLRAAE